MASFSRKSLGRCVPRAAAARRAVRCGENAGGTAPGARDTSWHSPPPGPARSIVPVGADAGRPRPRLIVPLLPRLVSTIVHALRSRREVLSLAGRPTGGKAWSSSTRKSTLALGPGFANRQRGWALAERGRQSSGRARGTVRGTRHGGRAWHVPWSAPPASRPAAGMSDLRAQLAPTHVQTSGGADAVPTVGSKVRGDRRPPRNGQGSAPRGATQGQSARAPGGGRDTGPRGLFSSDPTPATAALPPSAILNARNARAWVGASAAQGKSRVGAGSATATSGKRRPGPTAVPGPRPRPRPTARPSR